MCRPTDRDGGSGRGTDTRAGSRRLASPLIAAVVASYTGFATYQDVKLTKDEETQ